MFKWMICGLATLNLFAGELSLDSKAWFGNPLVWQLSKDALLCDKQSSHDFMLYTQAPVATKVTFETVFTPTDALTNEWRVAGPAIYKDNNNFWRLALVLTPPDKGNKHHFEFCEMLNNEWLSQSKLVCDSNFSDGVWQFNVPYRMRIELEEKGITGTIMAEDGKILFKQRHLYDSSKEAVKAGRPALSTTGFSGVYRASQAEWSAPLEEKENKKAFSPYTVKPNTDIKEKATGFFHVVQKADGQWWTIDPQGNGLVLFGIDHVTFHGHWCQKLGYAPYGKKNETKYPDRKMWEKETLDRLTSWGFNMLGAGCASELQRRGLVHTLFLSLGDAFGSLGGEYEIAPQEHRPCSVFPNVFHPDFERYCRFQAQLKCLPNREDPWLLGYFIDNELAWWGRGALDAGLFDYTMKKGAAHSAKIQLCRFVRERANNNLKTFNACWKLSLNTFDDLLSMTMLESSTPEQTAIKLAFLSHAAERYFAITTRAIRDADPNHLILGSRFAGTGGAHPEVWKISGKYCDVVTFNSYPMANLDNGVVYTSLDKSGEKVTTHFETYYNYVKRPMLITEWSFPALDSGLPCLYGAGQRFLTQTERTEATRLFARTMLSLPFLLGYDYFMWVDEPALGISDAFPEDSNYGLVNEANMPYPLITSMFAALHKDVKRDRAKLAPAVKAAAAPKPRTPYEVARQVSHSSTGTASLQREGDTFKIANGRLVLVGKMGRGPMIEKIYLDGTLYGYYNAMVHVSNKWPMGECVTEVKEKRDGNLLLVDITSVSQMFAEKFETCQRLIIAPNTPFFIIEQRSIKNVGAEPFSLKAVFFQVRSSYPPSTKQVMVPNLWGRPQQGCWVSAQGNQCLGAVAPLDSDVKIHFWLDPQGSQHADARCEVPEIRLAPGQKLPFDAFVLCLVGGDGIGTWEKQAREIVQRQ
jgi:hypothetical protein